MNPQADTFLTQSIQLSSLPKSYKVPREYIDCRQLLNIKLHGPSACQKNTITTKQKQKFKRKFYLDQSTQKFKNNPSPNKYLEKYSTQKRYKSQKTFITNLNQKQKNLGKRHTWIEDIQRFQQKYQPPSVGKYNLLTKSDFSIPKKSQSLQNLLKRGTKFNNFDDSIYVSAQIPGPGSHNPKKQISKIKVNMMNCNLWIKKHQRDDKRTQKILNQTKTSSFSYSPVKDKTFDSYKKIPKKQSTSMRSTNIDKRKGINSLIKSPGPGAHNVLNKWASQTFKQQNLVGHLQIFSKTTKSFPSLRVYH